MYVCLPGQNGLKCIRTVKMTHFNISIAGFTLLSSTQKEEHLHNTLLNKCDSMVCLYTPYLNAYLSKCNKKIMIIKKICKPLGNKKINTIFRLLWGQLRNMERD